jgi:hypothetical protein
MENDGGAMAGRLTVGSLRGVPHGGSGGATRGTVGGRITPPAPAIGAGHGTFRRLPPSLRGRGCCRSMCVGCPYTEAMIRRGFPVD